MNTTQQTQEQKDGRDPALREATGSAPRFFWKQCYELDDGEIHWALCDTESAPKGQCSCCYMVLLADYPTAIDGKPVGEQYMPALIARLLTEHFAKQNTKTTDAEGNP